MLSHHHRLGGPPRNMWQRPPCLPRAGWHKASPFHEHLCPPPQCCQASHNSGTAQGGEGEVRWLSSTIQGGKKDDLSPSQQVTGLLGSESRKYISPFVFTSKTFPAQVTTLEKWTKELDWPTQVKEATQWVFSREIMSSSIRWVKNS